MKRKVLFIINPISGIARKAKLPSQIEEVMDKNKVDYTIRISEYAGHTIELTREAVKDNFDVVVSMGGDGTLNEVARNLVGSPVSLGIIPLGSGNGLARHLGISLKVKEALQLINEGSTGTIDVCKINDHYFFSNAGIGFVADVINSYHGAKSRGFFAYALHVWKNIFHLRSEKFSLVIDGEKVEGKFFLVNFSNSNQFGYNMKIAPAAELNDGLIDLILIRSLPKFMYIPLLIDLFRGEIQHNKYVTEMKIKHLQIIFEDNLKIQIDGEPINVKSGAEVSVVPSGLKIIAPKLWSTGNV